ncbi:MAG TPA: hypothetical protein VD770_00875 [Coxiellaceae bacterium]|nr:hypothetical protein [Coxiellaceae bacterium]
MRKSNKFLLDKVKFGLVVVCCQVLAVFAVMSAQNTHFLII